MHKPFYASGFLYNLKTQQILLLQPEQKDNAVSQWSMFGGQSLEGEEAHMTFQRIIQELLGAELKVKHIYPIYDYFHQDLDTTNYVFYAEVGKGLKVDPEKEQICAWVTFQETLKLLLSAQTKRDVMVGERVIHLKQRQDEESESEVVAV